MNCDLFGRMIAGPVGSGKTTACIYELARRAMEQSPGEDGIRHTRFAIVRQTLKQLKDTVLKDVQKELGAIGDWRVSEGVFHLRFADVHSEWVFIPLENSEDQARLLSMQLTGSWLSECIEMNIDVLGPISGRLGRYPSGKYGAPTWFGIIADTNMPTEMSAWHQFMENLPLGWEKWIQPSGLDITVINKKWYGAENLNHLVQTEKTRALPINHPIRMAQGRKYYERFVQMYGEDSDWVKRYVKAEYGNDPSGQAVFRANFRRDFHVVKDTNVIPGYPLLVGQDFGRNPWSLIGQVDHMGRLLIHEEVEAMNTGLEKHVTQSLRPVLWSNRYAGMKVAIVGDPSGIAKGNVSEESCFDAMARLGFPGVPAPTNDIEPRLRAVDKLLAQQTNGGPTLMINGTRCPMLVRALNGGYRFTKTKLGALRVVPEKNDPEGYSHVVDDLQYMCLIVAAGMVEEIARRLVKRRPRVLKKVAAAAWT